LHEPSGIENEWQRLTQSGSASTNTWTDAYLAAFALMRGLKAVSFDGGFEKLLGANAIIL
jgi:predicted nucleic acid-binding protein